MPPLSELGWIIEAIKLIGRLAPMLGRLLPSDARQLPMANEELEAELHQQAAAFRGRLEAYLNDLRKQSQEQSLKLHRLQQEINGLRAELEAATALSRQIQEQLRFWRLWIYLTSGLCGFMAILLLVLLLRH